MSNNLAADKILQLLEDFRSTVRDFTAREGKLNQDLRNRIIAEQQRRDKSIDGINTQLAADSNDAALALQEGSERAKARFDALKTRLPKSHKVAKKQALDKVELHEGNRKYKLQTRTVKATRDRKEGLAVTEAAFIEMQNALAEQNGILFEQEEAARNAFKGYRSFRKLLAKAQPADEPAATVDEQQMLAELREIVAKVPNELKQFKKFLLPFLFRFTPLWIVLVLCVVPLVPVLQHFGNNNFTYQHAGIVVGALLVVGIVLHQVGKKQGQASATKLAAHLRRARSLHDHAYAKAEARRASEIERLEQEFQTTSEQIQPQWKEVFDEANEMRELWQNKIDQKVVHATRRNQHLYQVKLKRLQQKYDETVTGLNATAEEQRKEHTTVCDNNVASAKSEVQQKMSAMELEWKQKLQPLYEAVQTANACAKQMFPSWQNEIVQEWRPPQQFAHTAKFAHFDIDLQKLAEGLPQDERLALTGPGQFSLPFSLTYPELGSVLLETNNTGREEAISALNNIILRLFSVASPGRLAFTILDPVGLGQSFSGIMHLADYADYLINSRIWTQSSQIEQRLADLNEHMEKVIQMYLRNEYASIAEYNEKAGHIAEKYHFLVVADFPVNFTEVAAKRLLSIAASGARCGVYTLIHWDRRQALPPDFVPDDLRKSSITISAKGNEFTLVGKALPGASLVLEPAPSQELAIELINKIGVASRDSNRVEVPFSQVAPADAQMWSEDTTSELQVAIGRTGATKLQYLAIGKGTCQHALVAGKTGSGKSTLFHVMITNLALWCSPEQVEFYLIDFKKGVEFKCYATHRLPHAKVVAIESDREFGLSVLQRLDDELRRRGDLFRKLGVQDVAGYKKAGDKEPMPRVLLLIDEFQEFFVEDDKVAQTASLLLDRIVRQGRAFGIHAVLGSQTLGGAYTMARTTLGQMAIRIALQCNEADAYLIMDDNNPAPRMLSRPGEGIYNDAAGALQGNSPFQVVWLPDEVRDSYLAKVEDLAKRSGKRFSAPIVFEGNAPSDIKENAVLEQLLIAEAIQPTPSPRMFLGAPNSIKGPTEAVFRRQSGNNLLMVGQRDEAVLSILSVGLISLAAQFPAGAARFIIFDGNSPDSPEREYLNRVVKAIPHDIVIAKPGDLVEIMSGLATDMKARAGDEESAKGPTTFLFIHGLQKFSKLRYEDDFGFSSGDSEAPANPAVVLNSLLSEGTRLGFHVIATVDSYNNVNRFLSRKAVSEFEMRVLFQMSANDSASLIDSPKAGSLGLHRALFYNEQEGQLETFRPYALPDDSWIEHAGKGLERLAQQESAKDA